MSCVCQAKTSLLYRHSGHYRHTGAQHDWSVFNHAYLGRCTSAASQIMIYLGGIVVQRGGGGRAVVAACTYQTSFPSLLCIAPASASSPRLGFAAHDIIKSSKTDHSHCDCSRTKLRLTLHHSTVQLYQAGTYYERTSVDLRLVLVPRKHITKFNGANCKQLDWRQVRDAAGRAANRQHW